MTKVEANKVARWMTSEGYKVVHVCQDWTSKEWHVQSLNRAWMKRQIETWGEFLDLKA